MVFSSFSVTGCRYFFLLKCSIAVFTNILRIHPSKDPSPRKVESFLKILIKPSCKISSASCVLLAYRKQTPYIFAENLLYNSSCMRRSPSIHPDIKSLSLIIWLLAVLKSLFLYYAGNLPVYLWPFYDG